MLNLDNNLAAFIFNRQYLLLWRGKKKGNKHISPQKYQTNVLIWVDLEKLVAEIQIGPRPGTGLKASDQEKRRE